MSFTSFSSHLGTFGKRGQQSSAIRILGAHRSDCIGKFSCGQFHDHNARSFSTTSKTKGKQRPIFVAATKQHVGKTTTSLAVLSGLQKRFKNVGFLKPVGQQHVKVDIATDDGENSSIRVDKDVVLIKEHFNLDHIDYKYMSPVIIPKGYTRKFVDGEISTRDQQVAVEEAAEHISTCSDVVLIEGE
jgi:hypothetical protein